MKVEWALLGGLLLSSALAYLVTPIAVRVAHRFQFFDVPVGYKGHGRLTPYLGGSAVMAAFLAVCIPFAGANQRLIPIVAGTVLMWAVGTLDDRRTVPWAARVAVEAALAVLLFAVGIGWELGLGDAVDLLVTVAWIVGVVNALNLFDNMDGQASTMAVVISGALAVLAAVEGDLWLAVGGAALCGACLGFLPHNLASPSRIFLGDGGSMPIGFALAAFVMAGASEAAVAWQALAMGVLLVGVPAIDVSLVTLSRRRRGVAILSGGRDHLTHRTRQRLRTAQAVAVALGSVQALLAALALVAGRSSPIVLIGALTVFIALAGTLVALLDAPQRQADERDETPAEIAPAGDGSAPAWRGASALLLMALGVLCGLSPLADGFYASDRWAPAGLVLLVLVVAVAIARPPVLARRAVIALVALAGLAAWHLVSALWGDSIEQAVIAGNRYGLYLLAFGLFLLLVRSIRDATWFAGAFAVTAWAIAAFMLADFATGGGADMFVGARLDQPLGYINAQGTYFVLALWPALALAERRSPLPAGLGVAIAVGLAGLMLLTVSRGVALAVLGSVLVVMLVLPGRIRRGYLLVVVAGAAALLVGPAYDVYEAGQTTAGVDTGELTRHAVRTLVVAALAGAAWAGLAALATLPSIRSMRTAATGVLVVALLAAVAVGVANAGSVADHVSRQYRAFVVLSVADGGEPTASRLVSGAGNRYDYWRVAVNAWQRDPIVGLGGGNYDAEYFRERSTSEDVRQPHSIELQLLSETGIVGLALLVAFLAAVAAGVRRSACRARDGGLQRTLAVAATGMFAAWLVHTSFDWIHLLPGLTGVALGAAAILLLRGPDDRRPPARLRPAVVLAVTAVLAVAGLGLARQSLAEHFRSEAQAALPDDPARAIDRAERALRLDPEAVSAHVALAAAHARRGDGEAARRELLDAASVEPEDFLPYALLGDLAVRMGDEAEAARRYRQALERNPLEPTLREAVRSLNVPGG